MSLPPIPSGSPSEAPRVDSTTWSSGLSPVSDAEDLWRAVRSGSWKDAAIAGVGVGLDVVATTLDPLGMLAAAGVGWLIEHVRPLSDLLDQLTGDPDAVAAQARTWRAVAEAVRGAADDLRRSGSADDGWRGPAADAFARSTSEHAESLRAAGTAADTLAEATEGAGEVVATVRGVVRDLIAQLVSFLVVRVPQWTLEEVGTLGIATPHVVAAAASVITRTATRVVTLVEGVLRSLGRLGELVGRTGELFDRLGSTFARRAPAVGTAPMGSGRHDVGASAEPAMSPGPAGVSGGTVSPGHGSSSSTTEPAVSPGASAGTGSTGLGSPSGDPVPPRSRIRDALEPAPPPDPTGRTEVHRDRHGMLTDGRYRVNGSVHDVHRPGTAGPDKSVFRADVDPDRLALELAHQADREDLWTASNQNSPSGVFRNRAKIVLSDPIGTHFRTGSPTQVVNVYRRRSGIVHISPGSPR